MSVGARRRAVLLPRISSITLLVTVTVTVLSALLRTANAFEPSSSSSSYFTRGRRSFALYVSPFKKLLVPNAADSIITGPSSSASTTSSPTSFEEAFANVLSATGSDPAAAATSSNSASTEAMTKAVAKATKAAATVASNTADATNKASSAAAANMGDLADSMERLQRELMASVQTTTASPDVSSVVPAAKSTIVASSPPPAVTESVTQVAKATTAAISTPPSPPTGLTTGLSVHEPVITFDFDSASTASSSASQSAKLAAANMESVIRSMQERYQGIHESIAVTSTGSSSSSNPGGSAPSFAEFISGKVGDATATSGWLASEQSEKLNQLMKEMLDSWNPAQISASAMEFGNSLNNVGNVLSRGAWSSQDLQRALNLQETGGWYFGAASFALFVLGSGMTNNMQESYKYQKQERMIQEFLNEQLDNRTTTAEQVQQAELMRVESQVEQLTAATTAVANLLLDMQKEKAERNVDMARLKLDLQKMQRDLESNRETEKELRSTLSATQKELASTTSSLQQDLKLRAQAERTIQKKLAATEKALEASRARLSAASKKSLMTPAARNQINALQTEKRSLQSQMEAVQDEVKNLQQQLKMQTEKRSLQTKMESIDGKMENLQQEFEKSEEKVAATKAKAKAAPKKKAAAKKAIPKKKAEPAGSPYFANKTDIVDEATAETETETAAAPSKSPVKGSSSAAKKSSPAPAPAAAKKKTKTAAKKKKQKMTTKKEPEAPTIMAVANNVQEAGEGGEAGDWSRFAVSTLKRKTIKDLTAYLESRGADTTGPDGQPLKKDVLIEAIIAPSKESAGVY